MPDDNQTLPLILVIEDDAPMRNFLRTFLAGSGFKVLEAGTGSEALWLAAQYPPDVILLDLGLPDIDGQELLHKIREGLKSPIIVLSVRDQDQQKITALESGADDYLTKPFSTGELLARIRVALRHAADRQGENEIPVLETGNLKIDFFARRVFVAGQEVHLTPIEYKLLTLLARSCGRVLTHQHLLKAVWRNKPGRNGQHLRVFMSGLRRKIEVDPAQPSHLLTEPGVGYRLANQPQA